MIEPEKKKDWIKTGLLALAFIIVALVALTMMIGDPNEMPKG